MLRESPQQRPNIYQVVAETCAMRHRACPIKDVCTVKLSRIIALICSRYTLAGRNLKLAETSSYRLQNLKYPRHRQSLESKKSHQSRRYNTFQTSHL